MAQKTETPTFVVTSPIRAGFTHIVASTRFKKDGKEVGEPFFDASFMFAKEGNPDLAAIQTMVTAEARKLFPGKKLVARRLTQEEVDDGGVIEIQVPWQDGDKAADKAKSSTPPKDREFFRGHIIVKARTNYPPALSGIEGNKVVEYNDPSTRPTLEKLFYAGAYLAPSFGLHSYPAKDNKPGGVGLWLNAVCFVKHGPKLGGRSVNAAEVFKSFAGTVTNEDPGSNEMDDEIPF